ncbi:MAG: YggT family protein [Gammaproteobacteria bacterium]|nr:YggT family protein [Gammaproteobacteria bacterium]
MHAANNVLIFLIHTLFTLYIGAVVLRVILSATRADFYNPISQFLVTITNPVLVPLRKILPSIGPIDTASWVMIFGLKALELFLLMLIRGIQPGIGVLIVNTILQVIILIVSIFLYAVIIRAILSWFAGMNMGHNPILSILNSITEPILAPARKVIPPIGMFDLSAMAVILFLYSVLIALRSI